MRPMGGTPWVQSRPHASFPPAPSLVARAALAALAALVAACEEAAVPATPPIVPGASAAPREVNIVARDYQFSPPTVDLVPGETVLLHVVNGGLEVHEAVIGDQATQDAWEVAEAAVAEHPPGPTPMVRSRPRSPACASWCRPAAASTSSGRCRRPSRAHRGSSVATSPVTTRRGWSSPCG